MKTLSLLTLTAVALVIPAGIWTTSAIQADDGPAPNHGDSVGHRMDGKQTFENEEFGGNGRSCVTCHSTETGTVSPADAQARFAADPTDPLFRAKDSDDGTGSSYNRLLTWGIFRVTLPTHPNCVPADDPAATEVDLFRGTGNTINTAPFDELLMNDGREDNLEDQALGAVHAHFDNTEEPDAKDLERIAAFEHTRQFFSSDELYDFDNGGAPPELPPGNTPAEIRGRTFFEPTGMCGKCHGGAMLNTRNNGSRFTTSLVTAPVMTVLPRPNPNRTWRVKNPQNIFVNRIAEDPGRILQTGVFSDFGLFRIPTLWNVKNTAPYFHNNSAADLDILLKHYQEFFKRPPVFELLDDDEIPDVKAYLLLL
jgi:cytochrome c peroxidase